ncbi:MAG: aldo/keto reductase [Chloroflexi bacterium]|nr:MAG: aldo/keto reductase [Chloroflexota bacterium]
MLCLGTMLFGGESDEAASAAIYSRCRDLGINFFDCADVYMGGRSEEILGRLVASHRDELVLTSKVYFPAGKDINASGATRKHILRAIEGSLKRLGTDYIDVYFIHHFDEVTPLEETLRVLDDLVHQGKVLYPGASNFAAWQVMKGLGISAKLGLAPFAVLQPMYNLVKRQAEVEILPMAESEGLGVISYSPLGGGLLTGKYAGEQKPDVGRFLVNKAYQKRYGDDWMRETAARFGSFARERGFDPAGLAVAWVAGHPAVTAPIIGARSLQQLEGSLKALEIDMTPELRAEISALSIDPPLATDRTDERGPDTYTLRTRKGNYGTQSDRH